MKKYNLLKVIGITVAIVWLLTLFVPSSVLDYSGKVTTNSVSGIGVFGLLSNLSISISYFNGIAVFLIAVAGFYAIVNKLDVYEKFVSNTSSVFKNKEGLFVAISVAFFGMLACIVKDAMILIMFMPFVYQVMKKLEIDKKVILSSTIVATLIGAMCGIYNRTLFSMFNLEINTLLLVKIIVLVLSLAVLIFFTAPKKVEIPEKKTAKKQTKEEKKKTSAKKVSKNEKKVNKVVYAVLTILLGCIGVNKFYAGKIKAGILSVVFCWTFIPFILSIAEFITVLTEEADKDSNIPVNSIRRENVAFIVCLCLFAIFTISAVIPWEVLINKFKVFTDFNTWLAGININGYSIFGNLIGSPVVGDSTTGTITGVIAVIGNWELSDMSIFLFIMTIVIGLCKNVKIDDFISSVTNGVKNVLPVAITAMLISIVLVITVTTGINITIANWIVSLAKGFNIVTFTLASIVGSVLTADFYYFISTVCGVFTSTVTDKNLYGVIAFLVQNVYYLTMIVAPTSVALIIGLYYLDIPYTKWCKYIWKVLLSLFVIVMIATIIIFVLV